MATITSANAVYLLTIPGLFAAQQLQGFSTDDIFTTEAISPVTAIMGLDGILSGGFAPNPKIQSIVLQADSPSSLIFDAWQAAQDTILDAYPAQAILTLPGLGRVYTMIKGFLTNYAPVPDARRTLQPRRFQITWQNILAAPLGGV